MWYNGYKNHVEKYSGGVFVKSAKERRDEALFRDNLKNYILEGCSPVLTRYFCRKTITVTAVAMLLIGGIYPWFKFKGYFLLIPLVFVLVNLFCIITVYSVTSLKSKVYGHRERLIMNLVRSTMWTLDICLIEMMYFFTEIGVHISVLLLYVPVILVPVIMGFIAHKNMHTKRRSVPKAIVVASAGTSFFFYMWVTRMYRRYLRHNQFAFNITIIVLLAIMSTAVSTGLLNIQRLYYMDKYKITFEEETD
jgi:hypothetical protein